MAEIQRIPARCPKDDNGKMIFDAQSRQWICNVCGLRVGTDFVKGLISASNIYPCATCGVPMLPKYIGKDMFWACPICSSEHWSDVPSFEEFHDLMYSSPAAVYKSEVYTWMKRAKKKHGKNSSRRKHKRKTVRRRGFPLDYESI